LRAEYKANNNKDFKIPSGGISRLFQWGYIRLKTAREFCWTLLGHPFFQSYNRRHALLLRIPTGISASLSVVEVLYQISARLEYKWIKNISFPANR